MQIDHKTSKHTLLIVLRAYNALDKADKNSLISGADCIDFNIAQTKLSAILDSSTEYEKYYQPGKGFKIRKIKP